MAETWGNFPLTSEQTYGNAEIFYGYFEEARWTPNAIYGGMGNWEAESGMNPGALEGYVNIGEENYPGFTGGFGNVQWTPAGKYIYWAQSQGFSTYSQYGRIYPNVLRMLWEVANNEQWQRRPDVGYNIGFEEWTQSTETPEYLARAFMLCYERPLDQGEAAQAYRASRARWWADNLAGGVVPPTPRVRRDGGLWLSMFP